VIPLNLQSRLINKIQPALFSLLLLFSLPAWSELTIEINEGYENALPIAIVPFGYEEQLKTGEENSSAKGKVVKAPVDLAAIISADLRRSGHFRPISADSMPAYPTDIEGIDFIDWRVLDIDNMLIGKVVDEGNGLYQIDMRFMDVLRKNQVMGKRWVHIPKDKLRQIAHQISDLIYEELTGIRGAFNTQIAYVTLRKVSGKRLYTLEIADSDGFNPQPILKSRMPIMSPSWSPDGSKLAYVSFESGRSNVVVQSLDGKYRKVIANFKGINGAPAWSPDGKKMALTLSKAGSADIYIMDLQTKKLRRLTRNWSIETEATWAANGQSLFFNSDRRGQPQVFQVFLDTGEIRRVTFEGKYNGNPEISPDGRYLAVVHGQGGFHIGLQDLYTNEFTVLTDTFLDESPTFSPNGEMILYAMNKNGKGVLAVVAIDGKASQTLKVKNGEVREPAWGPYLNK
jgi:TolB protein